MLSWREVHFEDHAGRPARSGWWPDPSEDDRMPVLSIQIYSTIPIEESVAWIESFLSGDDGRLRSLDLRWDLYEPMADLPACVDHQRLEIAYRLAVAPHTHPLHPIPRYLAGMSDGKGCDGFLIVLTSDLYKLDGGSELPGEDYDPGNPIWVSFQRATHTNVIERSSLRDPRGKNKGKDDSDQLRYYRELLEMHFHRIQSVGNIGIELWEFFLGCATGEDEDGLNFDLSLDNDELVERSVEATSRTSPPDPPASLSRLNFDLSVMPTRPPGSSTEGIVISNYAGDIRVNPTIRYLVYLNFGKQSDMKLSTVGLRFTSEVLRRLDSDTTVYFEFFPTPSDTKGYSRTKRILKDTRAQLSARPGFTIGGLQPDGSRAFPITRSAFKARWRHETYYSTFSIILESSDFGQKPNVLFALDDGGDRISFGEIVGKDELEVWRSTGMDAVAQRLRFEQGVRIVDEPKRDDLLREWGLLPSTSS